VSHVIKVTSKASADSPVGRRRGQAQIEAHLEAAGLARTLLRSNAYMQNLLALAPMIKQTGGFLMSAGPGEDGKRGGQCQLRASTAQLVQRRTAGGR
jgi:uncharacterized protein YbjT (DUF2867 family)